MKLEKTFETKTKVINLSCKEGFRCGKMVVSKSKENQISPKKDTSKLPSSDQPTSVNDALKKKSPTKEDEKMKCVPKEQCGDDVLDTYAVIECNAVILVTGL